MGWSDRSVPARTLSLRDLVADPRLKLRLVAGAPAASTVESAHTSDLPHPGRYILPGELVLTNGLWLKETTPSAWVEEVQLAGAAGLGFGLSDHQREVPTELVEACEAVGLPLLEVPEDLSFSLVSKHVHERTAGYASAALRRQLLRARRLTQSLVSGGGHQALVDFLTAETGLSAAFVGPGGRLVSASGDAPGEETRRRAALAALRRQLPRSITDQASAFGIAGSLPGTTLVVGAAMRDIPDESRLLIEQIATYSAFEDARERALEDARRAMASELISLVLSDQISERAFVARVAALRLAPSKPLAVIAADHPIELLAYAAAAANATCVVAQHDSCQVILVEDPDENWPEQLAEAIVGAGDEPVLGCSRPMVGGAALRRSLAEASAALKLARAKPEGERIVREAEIGSHELLLELIDPRELGAYRDAILGPLEEWDAEHGSSLVETLRTFLDCGGHWREAASALHIHHNTLRYRLDRVEHLTGLDLSETAGRVDLFLALAADTREQSRAGD